MLDTVDYDDIRYNMIWSFDWTYVYTIFMLIIAFVIFHACLLRVIDQCNACYVKEMVSLKLQKRLAASVLGCGKRKVWLGKLQLRPIIAAINSSNTSIIVLWLIACSFFCVI